MRLTTLLLASLLALHRPPPATAQDAADVLIPVLAPLTGFLAAEGRSQRNGAVLALQEAPAGLRAAQDVADTGTSPEAAGNAFERAVGSGRALAVAAPILGTQMLALLPLAAEAGVPLLTISGTASLTRQGNPWVFRFFPEDAVTKAAQIRYAVEERGYKHPAVLYQTTAYGQSGHAEIAQLLAARGIQPAYEDGLDVGVRDMGPVLAKARAAGADVLLLHLHAGPSALLLRAAAAMRLGIPVVAGSGLSQPSTAALLEPSELAGTCAETGASPASAETPGMAAFADRYRAAFGSEPDAFAVAQYDAVAAALRLAAAGARTPEALRAGLASGEHPGLAATYRNDGRGNMAHQAVIVCYDRGTRVPSVVRRYDQP